MKKYTRYSIRLFAGMLTLSSCTYNANTKQGMFINRPNLDKKPHASSNCSTKKQLCYVVAGALVLVGGTGALLAGSNSTEAANSGNGKGGTAFTPTPNSNPSYRPHTNMPATTDQSILDGISKGQGKYGASSTKQPSPKLPSTEDPRTSIQNPNEISEDNWQYLSENGFSREAIEKLFNNGLNPNATDKEGKSILTNLIDMQRTDLVEVTLKRGGNPCKVDSTGHSPRVHGLKYEAGLRKQNSGNNIKRINISKETNALLKQYRIKNKNLYKC